MSGISKIKERAKLSIDEYYDDTTPGVNADIQKPGQPDTQQSNHTAKQTTNNKSSQLDNQPNIQKDYKQNIHSPGQPTNKLPIKPETQEHIQPYIQPAATIKYTENKNWNTPGNQQDGFPDIHTPNNPELQNNGLPFSHEAGMMATHPSSQPSGFPGKQARNQKPSTYKMTFNLTENIYKAFNDLYAHRMLQGCKTEKSEMICEAIELLLQNEGQK